jgi:hypothetical protein
MTAHTRRWIDQHFAGSTSQRHEQAMRRHLTGCADCRAYYARHQVLAQLDPKALGAEARLALGLSLPLRRRQKWALPMPALVLAAGTLAAGLALGVGGLDMPWPGGATSTEQPSGGFVARGGPAGQADELVVYRVPLGARPQPLDGRLKAGEELAFAYKTDAAAKLLVFAVDEHKNVYWYFPAWTNAAETPRSIAVAATPELTELPDAVAHDFKGSRLTLHAVFTEEALSVRDVERWVSAIKPDDAGQLPFRHRRHMSMEFVVD